MDDKPDLFPLPWWAVLLIYLTTWPAAVLAAEPLHIHERDAVTVKLMPGACVDPTTMMLIATNLPPDLHDKFRAIESNWLMRDGSRKDYAGCWLEVGDDFLMVFSDATGFRISKAAFKKLKGMWDS